MADKLSKKRRIRLVDFEQLYSDTTGTKVLNDSSFTGRKVNDERIAQLFYDIDPELGFVASCECKKYRGNYYAGHKCPHCGTLVSSEFTSDMMHVNWIVLPDHVPPMLHPVFYMVFKDWLGKTKSGNVKTRTKIPLIQALLDPSEPLPPTIKSHVKRQGFRYFSENIEDIMDFFFNTYRPTKMNKNTPFVKELYEEYRHLMFIRRFPSLHPSLTPIAKEGKIRAIDPAAASMMAATSNASILGFESRRSLTENKYVDKMLWKVYADIVAYVELIITKKFGDKFAHVRRHIMGARIHYSARSVIVPIVDPHRGDEIHIPWKIALGALKNEILNILINRKGHHFQEALAKYMRALVIYDDDIYKIMLILIKECPYKGLPVLAGRNPTLILGAIQLVFATKIKIDVYDETIAISPRICKAPNADFDGDEMYLLFIKEMGMVQHLQNLHPRTTILSKSDLGVDSLVAPTNQATIHWNSFLGSAIDVPKEVRFELPNR